MPVNSVWMLDASLIAISGGASLDGITQGNGSHLVGRSITLTTNDWRQTWINDNDANFDDNDSTQQLAGAQVINGQTYASGTGVEAEYRLTLRDPDGNLYQVYGYNVNNSSPSYGTIEGLAFLGPVGGFPPVGVPLTVVAAAEGPGAFGQPVVQYGELASPPCFTPGALIRTPLGLRPVQDLRPGDRVMTRDNGAQPVIWVGKVRVTAARMQARPAFCPVRIAAGALGGGRPSRDLVVSQQHRILIAGWRSDLYYGLPEVLVAARHLLGRPGITLCPPGDVTYIHLLFDRHQVIWADDQPTESLHPHGADNFDPAARAELLSLFPALARGEICRPLARPALHHWEAALLTG